VVVAWVGGGWHSELALQHELARHELSLRPAPCAALRPAPLLRSAPLCTYLLNPAMTLQTCLQARSLKQRFVSCSQVKRNACKRVTQSIQTRNRWYDTNVFFRGLRPLKRTLRNTNWSYRDGTGPPVPPRPSRVQCSVFSTVWCSSAGDRRPHNPLHAPLPRAQRTDGARLGYRQVGGIEWTTNLYRGVNVSGSGAPAGLSAAPAVKSRG
jgi:hypothetical protein